MSLLLLQVIWKMQTNRGDEVEIEAGDTEGNYEAEDFEEMVKKKIRRIDFFLLRSEYLTCLLFWHLLAIFQILITVGSFLRAFPKTCNASWALSFCLLLFFHEY